MRFLSERRHFRTATSVAMTPVAFDHFLLIFTRSPTVVKESAESLAVNSKWRWISGKIKEEQLQSASEQLLSCITFQMDVHQ